VRSSLLACTLAATTSLSTSSAHDTTLMESRKAASRNSRAMRSDSGIVTAFSIALAVSSSAHGFTRSEPGSTRVTDTNSDRMTTPGPRGSTGAPPASMTAAAASARARFAAMNSNASPDSPHLTHVTSSASASAYSASRRASAMHLTSSYSTTGPHLALMPLTSPAISREHLA